MFRQTHVVVSKLPLMFFASILMIHQIVAIPHRIWSSMANGKSQRFEDYRRPWKVTDCLSMVRQEFSFMYRETGKHHLSKGGLPLRKYTNSLNIFEHLWSENHQLWGYSNKPWLMNYASHPPKNDIIRYQNSTI